MSLLRIKELEAQLARRDERIAELEKGNQQLLAALKEARRAIGDHYAPDDCYATGPMTDNGYRDLVECPACSAIAMYDAIVKKSAT